MVVCMDMFSRLFTFWEKIVRLNLICYNFVTHAIANSLLKLYLSVCSTCWRNKQIIVSLTNQDFWLIS